MVHPIAKPHLFMFMLLGVFVAFIASNAMGQDDSSTTDFANAKPAISDGGGVIPVRIVSDRLVVSCDISGPRRRLPVNLWLDFDGAYGLQLHNRAAAPLPAESADGQAFELTLHFPDFTLTVPRRELGDEEAFEDFTKYHSNEIGENALVGAIGAHVLKHFDIVFELGRGRVTLRPAGQLAGRSPGTQGNEIVVPITEHNDLVWLPVLSPDDDTRAMAVGTISYDTLIDRTFTQALGHPDGHLEYLRCASVDFAPLVAFRPEPIVQVHPDDVAGVMGINLLESLRLQIDRENSLATIQVTDVPAYPDADLAFFQARNAEDTAQLAGWLDAHGSTRLASEAAELLLTWNLELGADLDETGVAIRWIHDTIKEDLRATRMLDLMEELSNEGEIDLVLAAGEIGIESGRADRYPDAVHKIHGRLGELLLERDEGRAAWRHLLSAAFGLPEDGMINLNLGRYYEDIGRPRRAFSRYIQAVIKEESGPQAMAGMQRLDASMPADQRLSLDTIERMIAGKVRNYGAPMKFEPSDDTPVRNRVSLVEFFTNAHIGDETRGAIGGALGFQGLTTHFTPEHCVFLSYHLPVPRPDPLVNELAIETAAMLGVGNPTVQIVDGDTPGPGAGRWRDAEAIYSRMRGMVLDRLRKKSRYEIDLQAAVESGRIVGSVEVAGPRDDRDVHVQVILAERGVVFPGKSSVVIHRMVARASLLPETMGASLADAGQGSITFDRSFEDIVFENTRFLDELEASGAGTFSRMSMSIDPRSIEVVVIVRDKATGRVLQAAQVTPTAEVEDDMVHELQEQRP